MKIVIKSDLPFSEYKFDLAYGRVKRFLKSDDKSRCYAFEGFAVTMKKHKDSVTATIKAKNA